MLLQNLLVTPLRVAPDTVGLMHLHLQQRSLRPVSLVSRRTVPVQQHLQRVYVTLCGALLAAAAGVYVSIATRGGLGGWLAIAGFVGSSVWLASTPASPANLNKR